MAGKAKIGAIIALDGEKDFKQAVTSCNKELTRLKAKSGLVKEQFIDQANTLEALSAKHEVLSKVLDTHRKKEAETTKGLDHAKEVYKNVGDGLEKLKKQQEEATKKLDDMKKSTGTASKEIEEQEKHVKELSAAIEKGEKNYQTAANRIRDWETKLNTAQVQTIRANRELAENARYMNEARNAIDHCAVSIDACGKRAEENIPTVMRWKEVVKTTAVAKISNAIITTTKDFGSAAIESAQELDIASSQLQASTGIARDALNDYREVMENVYKENYGDNFEDVGNAIAAITQNIKDLDPANLQKMTENSIALRDTFGFDFGEQIRAVKMLMDTFGISGEKAYNLIAQGAQKGLNKNGDLLDVINEYSVHYKQMGAGAEEFFNSLENGTAAGTFSVDKLGDAYKEFGIRVKDTATTTTEGYQLLGLNADKMRTQFAAGGESAKAATDTVLNALFQMDDKVKQNQAGVDLFGTMWEDLGIEGVKALTNLNGGISTTKDVLSDIKDIKYDNMTNQLTQLGRVIQMKLAEPLANQWLPMATSGLEMVADHLEVTETAVAGLGTAILANKALKSKTFINIVSAVKNFTVATEGATVAQKALNLAQSMSPAGMLALAIGGVTAAIVGYSLATRNADESTQSMTESLKEERAQIEENADARKQSTEKKKEEWEADQLLVDRLYELNEVENKTIAEKEAMKAIVSQLSEDIPELAEAYDQETGALNMTKKATEELLEAKKRSAVAQALQDEMQGTLKDMAEAQIAIGKLDDELETLGNRLDELNKKDKADITAMTQEEYVKYQREIWDITDRMQDAREEQEEWQKTLKKGEQEYDSTINQMEKYADSQTNTQEAVSGTTGKLSEMSEAEQQAAQATAEMTEEQAQAYKEMQESISGSIKNVVSVFDEFSGGTKITAQEIKENLSSQIEGVTNWAENMKTLAGAAGQGMTQEFYNYLADMGPQSANLVQTLVDTLKNNKADFENICEQYGKAANLSEPISEEVTAAGNKLSQSSTELAETNREVLDSIAQSAAQKAKENGEYIGANQIAGITQGILTGQGSATAAMAQVTENILIAAKKKADIHSPSRKAKEEIGEQITAGIAVGIRAVRKHAEESARHTTGKILTAAVDTLGLYKEKIRTKTEEAFGVSWFKENSKGESVQKTAEEYYNELYSAASKYFDNYSALHTVSLEKEVYYWEQIHENLEKGTQARIEAAKKLRTARTALRKEEAAARKEMKAAEKEKKAAQKQKEEKKKEAKENKKQYALSGDALSLYKTYYKVSERAEIAYWNIVRKQFKKGTADRIEADQKYLEAKETYNNRLKELNEEYYENCRETNEKLADNIKDLQDAYTESVNTRKDEIYSGFGLFDRFESTSYSGRQLLRNLKSQVAGYAEWELELSKLREKGVLSDELMSELSNMGPAASASIQALNQLNKEELAEYQDMWQQKNDLAYSQAVKENEALKTQTRTRIEELKLAAQQELDVYKQEYEKAIAEVRQTIDKPLKKLANKATDIGEKTVVKMISGIKKGATKKSTKTTLKEVNTNISDTLGELPSDGKVIGEQTLQGILDGLTNKKKIQLTAKSFVEYLKKAIKEAADIHSPSRLFKTEIGVQLSAGVAEGIREETKAVTAAGTDMIHGMLEQTKKGIAVQQDTLSRYAATVSSAAGYRELNRLTSTPMPQVSVTADNSELKTLFAEILFTMQDGFERLGNMQIVTDTGALVGELSGGMSETFARNMRKIR